MLYFLSQKNNEQINAFHYQWKIDEIFKMRYHNTPHPHSKFGVRAYPRQGVEDTGMEKRDKLLSLESEIDGYKRFSTSSF